VTDLTALPDGLPVPDNDGAADHLRGAALPDITLASTAGGQVALNALPPGRTIIYVYPLTGRPGFDLPMGWDAIPGARGCTTEACDFRDHHQDLLDAGASAVYGLSSQDTEHQRELVERLHLPFAMLADPKLETAQALQLPTFSAGGQTLFRRLTLVLQADVVEHAFYPIFPPNQHAREVLTWLRVVSH